MQKVLSLQQSLFFFVFAKIARPIMKGIELVERKRNFKVTEAIEREDRRGKYRALYFFFFFRENYSSYYEKEPINF